MHYKKLLIAGFAAVLASAVTTAVMADDSGLTLISKGKTLTSPIRMTCQGLNLPSFFKIQPNSQVHVGWNMASIFIPSGIPYYCSFNLDDQAKDLVGTAVLELQPGGNAGEISDIVVPNPAYTVTISTPQDVFEQTMTLTLTKN